MFVGSLVPKLVWYPVHVFVPSAEVSTANPIKVLLCRPHFDLLVRVNRDIAPKNKENMAHVFARFISSEWPENVLIMYYVACCPGPENEGYRILARYKYLSSTPQSSLLYSRPQIGDSKMERRTWLCLRLLSFKTTYLPRNVWRRAPLLQVQNPSTDGVKHGKPLAMSLCSSKRHRQCSHVLLCVLCLYWW